MTHLFSNKQIKPYLLLAALFGIITTFFTYNFYAGGDHNELVPILNRAFDPTYLQNDFFTNAADGNISRLYYAKLVTFLAGSEQNLYLISFILVLISNTATSIVTYYFGRDFFRGSDVAGIYASALAMSIFTFSFGWQSTLYSAALIPTTLAIPMVLGAIWAASRENLILAILVCGIMSFVHPQVGLELGALLLFTAFCYFLLKERRFGRDLVGKLLLPLILFLPFVLISLIPFLQQPRIDAAQYIYILADFRTPHHRLPSTFGLRNHISTAAYVSAIILLYIRQWKSRDKNFNLFIGILGGIILLLALGGYVFVEVIPLRIWATAQTLRLLFILKWLGLIFIAGLLASVQLDNSIKTMFIIGVLNPITMAGATWAHALKDWLREKQNHLSRLLDPNYILLIAVAILIFLMISVDTVLLLAAYIFLILFFKLYPQKRFIIPLLSLIAIVLIAAAIYRDLPTMGHSLAMDSMADLAESRASELGSEGDEVAMFARLNTPQDAVFLTPPAFGHFRVLARRAIVVDFKSFPFSDTAMLQWYERMTTIYGHPSNLGFDMLGELTRNYAGIDDQSLADLQEQYPFTHAILLHDTQTQFEVLFQNELYKIVRVEN